MNELAKGTLDKFSDFLYAIAPGFVLLFSLMIVDHDGSKLGLAEFFRENAEWKLVGIGILLGLVSYSFHVAILEDLIEWVVIFLCRGKTSVRDLTRKRWERSGSNVGNSRVPKRAWMKLIFGNSSSIVRVTSYSSLGGFYRCMWVADGFSGAERYFSPTH